MRLGAVTIFRSNYSPNKYSFGQLISSPVAKSSPVKPAATWPTNPNLGLNTLLGWILTLLNPDKLGWIKFWASL
jgi:hypothetical protein